MVKCFACCHRSNRNKCQFFRFPSMKRKQHLRNQWISAIRRPGREPSEHSRICSCHFTNGNKENIPQVNVIANSEETSIGLDANNLPSMGTSRNSLYSILSNINLPLFNMSSSEMLNIISQPSTSGSKMDSNSNTLHLGPDVSFPFTLNVKDNVNLPTPLISYAQNMNSSFCQINQNMLSNDVNNTSSLLKNNTSNLCYATNSSLCAYVCPLNNDVETDNCSVVIENNTLKTSLELAKSEIKFLKSSLLKKPAYSFNLVSEKVLKMETGIPSKDTFMLICDYVKRKKDDFVYYLGWKVDFNSIVLEDQIFITLMKLRQNYTFLHIATLFSCSVTTVRNVFMTYIDVLHNLLFEEMVLKSCPSRHKNKLFAPSCFSKFPNCRMIVDCTDINIEVPKQMNKQRLTYSTYKSKNTLKALIGISPSCCITFVSKLYPGSVSDKIIFKNCGVLDIFEPGDLILADKGFKVQDILKSGVSVNVPPFLNNPKFTKSEIITTKNIANCRIHVERIIQRIKLYKILNFVPFELISNIDIVFQLVAALVNLQTPIIKKIKLHV